MKDFHLRFCVGDMADLFAKSLPARLLGEKSHNGWFDTNDGYNTFNLLEDEVSDIPDKPGAYVLGTRDGTMITYPWGVSPIYYIGKASDLRNRLLNHKKHTLGAKKDHTAGVRRMHQQDTGQKHIRSEQNKDHPERGWWPRYQYGAAFGADCVWYAHDDMDPQNLEARLIESFYWAYGAIPVTNHKWPKHLEPKLGWPE